MEFEVKPFIYTTKMKELLQILLLTVAFTGCQNQGVKKADLSSADSVLVDSLFVFITIEQPKLIRNIRV